MSEDILVPGMVFGMITICVIGLPLARAFARRMDAKSAQPRTPPEVIERLERMEQAIDSIAVEVERISEGQRFTAKLLAERPGAEVARALPPREPGA